ncbi:MAG TPA: tRNA (adenosine(37)-N6)-dimethylallyltransferase MiaA [Flavitalea sp.]|nr:tRNA (adenosine(37)-N6)-dimethylallyltransferase MiaA [Flavitalea sp.]
MIPKTIIIITGPTAVGKTSLAIDLARQYNTSIISADSRQCFQELNIGVAKPPRVHLEEIPHFFINSHVITQEVHAGTFEGYAMDAVSRIFSERDIAIMAGGTGLYIRAFCEGLDSIPQIPAGVRQQIVAQYAQSGMEWLHQEVEKKDPLFFAEGEIRNPQRLMRALEVMIYTGKSIREFQQQKKITRNFSMLKIGLELDSDLLKRNIQHRVDEMIEKGLAGEVRQLITYRGLNALRTVGYTELFEHFDGKISLNEAIEKIKANTRAYAKRQMTWFKKDKEITWFDARNVDDVKKWVELKLKIKN